MSAGEILRNGKVFQGGNWNHLHKLLELRSGQSLLYVGDHMYSDILRSKRTLGWRTLLIVPELQHELRSAKRAAERQGAVARLRGEVSVLDEMLQELALRRLGFERELTADRTADDAVRFGALTDETMRMRERHRRVAREANPGRAPNISHTLRAVLPRQAQARGAARSDSRPARGLSSSLGPALQGGPPELALGPAGRRLRLPLYVTRV